MSKQLGKVLLFSESGTGGGGDYVGESIQPNTSFRWKTNLKPGRYTLRLELACHRHFKGGRFEFRVGRETVRGHVARTESVEDFRLMRLGVFAVKGGVTEIEFRVVAAGERFARLRAVHISAELDVTKATIESVEIPELDYASLAPRWELWARDFIGVPGKDIEIRMETDSTHQAITGIGGTFNEQGGHCLASLPEKEQKRLLTDLFGGEGAAFAVCCLPVGASDFALSPYSLADSADDFGMEHFTTKRDEEYLLPFVKKAQKVERKLRFHARPWSPPAWMKTTGSMNSGSLRKEDAVYRAHALYLCRFCEAMAERGVPIERLVVQNEPDVAGGYSGCIWTPEEYARFVVEFLRPQADQCRLKTQVWGGSFQGIWKPTAQRVMAYPGFAEAVKGIGFQYNLIDNVIDFRLRHPGMPIMHTESPCHDGRNSWEQAFALYQDIINYLNAGADAYTYWNMILDEPALSYTGWKQNSLVNVDRLAGTVRYNPDFHIMRLFSRGIRPGAVRIEAFCFGKKICAVKNVDGSVVVFVDNPAKHGIGADISLDGELYPVSLPPLSLSAIRLA